jgi:hypothetical protein
MMDVNNQQLADVILAWLADKVPSAKVLAAADPTGGVAMHGLTSRWSAGAVARAFLSYR